MLLLDKMEQQVGIEMLAGVEGVESVLEAADRLDDLLDAPLRAAIQSKTREELELRMSLGLSI